MQTFLFRDCHVTIFRHPSWACSVYLANSWSQTLQTSKK